MGKDNQEEFFFRAFGVLLENPQKDSVNWGILCSDITQNGSNLITIIINSTQEAEA